MEPALWTSMRGLGIVYGGTAAFLMSVLLAGCATAPFPKPADFSFHTPAPPLDIHWKLSVDPSIVQADGLIERHRPEIGSARIQLLGLDAAGRIVSFTTPILIFWRSTWDLEPFTIRLRPRGQEQRYEVRVFSFGYQEEPLGPGS